jgi:heme/copper-type cytochrome/quinol oxidase subunit 1
MNTTKEQPDAAEVHRRALVIVGMVLLADSGLTALVMRFSQLRSEVLLSPDAYNKVFTAHGLLLFALFPALLLLLARLRPQASAPSRGLLYVSAWVAWGAVLVAGLVTGIAWLGVVRFDRTSALTAGAFSLAPVCAAAHLTLDFWKSEKTAGLVVIMLVGWSLVVGLSTSWVTNDTTASLAATHLAVAALGALHDNAVSTVRYRNTVGFVALFGAAGLPVLGGLGPLGTLIALSLGFGYSIRVVRASLGRPDASPGEKAFAVLSALTFAEALLGGQFVRIMAVDVYLHDTLFSVAVYHLGISSSLFAVVALLHGRAPDVPRRGPPALFGATMAFIGSHLFHFGLAVAGTRGMPRRYMNYLEEFQTLQVVATAGSLMLVGGLALGLFAALWPGRGIARA